MEGRTESSDRAVELSIVVPCYNEEATLEALYSALVNELSDRVDSWEILLVDDGSRDDTRLLAGSMATSDPRVRALGLSRNFGKEAAMYAGLQAARGRFVIIMDADLQHPPELIPAMLDYGRRGWDQVVARRTRGQEKVVRKSVSRLYYRLVNGLMEVRLTDGAGDFRLISRRCVDALLQLGEVHRFSKGMFAWVGFSQMEIKYDDVASSRDGSTWTMRSLFNYAIEGVLSFNSRPLRLAIWMGVIVICITVAYSMWILLAALINGVDTPGYVTTIAISSLMGGVQLLTLGIIGEYVGRIFNETKRRPIFLLSYDSQGSMASPQIAPHAFDGSLDEEPEVVDLAETGHTST